MPTENKLPSLATGHDLNQWRLVTVEPTDDMTIAFAEAWYSKRQTIDDPDMKDAYRAMLAAAPTPPQPIYDEAKEISLCMAAYESIAGTVGGFYKEFWLGWNACLDEVARLNAAQPVPVAAALPVDPERERLMEIVQQYPNVDPLKYDAAVRTLRK